MHTLAEHPVDADTTRTAFAFLNRASETFAVKGAILFGSRAWGSISGNSGNQLL